MFVKISNIYNLDDNGNLDYKGVDINNIKPMSIFYPDDNCCYFILNKGDVPEHDDITIISDDDYNSILINYKEKRNVKNPVEEIEKKIKTLQDAVDQLILDSLTL